MTIDLAQSAEFALAQAQMERLVKPCNEGGPDWARVIQCAVTVLGSQGKDLSMAVWLTVAGYRSQGLPGLAAGIHVLREVVVEHWGRLTPPPERMRARRNKIEWLMDVIIPWLGGDQATAQHSPLPAAVHQTLLDDWDAMGQFWSSHDDSAPAWHRLKPWLERVPTLEVRGLSETQASLDADQAGVLDGEGQGDASGSGQALDVHCSTNVDDDVERVAGVQLPADASPQRLRSAAATGLDAWGPFLKAGIIAAPSTPYFYRINRLSTWALIESAPQAYESRSRVPPPSDATATMLHAALVHGDAHAIVQFCESQLRQHPFWFDLNRHSAQALTRLGADDASGVVRLETASFLARIPGGASLLFVDDTPFVSDETLAWLGHSTNTPAPGASEGPLQRDPLDLAIQASREQTATSALELRLGALERLAAAQVSTREHFRVRMAQCELLNETGGGACLAWLMRPMVEQIRRHQLTIWEPELARRALALLAACSPWSESREPRPEVVSLAAMDLTRAWQVLSRVQA
ncbi:TssA family type VI secretion system protein [Pandoraea iniqua]|uniref:TssA family type VI secretion system protein n=1 Tax=Pandoraea iniqua TaxID=2508288 RepID=UPI0015840EDC|nr:TssA family type VI secretion system protein [Pandoraea iniqua]